MSFYSSEHRYRPSRWVRAAIDPSWLAAKIADAALSIPFDWTASSFPKGARIARDVPCARSPLQNERLANGMERL